MVVMPDSNLEYAELLWRDDDDVPHDATVSWGLLELVSEAANGDPKPTERVARYTFPPDMVATLKAINADIKDRGDAAFPDAMRALIRCLLGAVTSEPA